MEKTWPEHSRSIEWNDSLSIGIETIDQQHKTLIERLQAVTEAIEMSQGEGTIAKTLDFLLDYTVEHFSAEEKSMAEHSYPELGHQKRQHAEFKNAVNKLVDDFEQEGAVKDIADHIRDFLFIWLKKHIKEADLPFGRVLAENSS